ncbi:hypothetical protein [Streptomyces sp. NPDC047043]|uniref:hypothetical protein n=1 Tax=Streptomyces sp. NPDC047043 TaxID=3154497 RepID=UPI0033E5D5CF
MVVAAWRLCSTGVDRRFRSSPWPTAALALSSVAVVCLGVYGVLDTLGLTPAG